MATPDHYHHHEFDKFNDIESAETKTALDGEATAKEIQSEVSLGKDIKNGIPNWAEWAFKPRGQRLSRN